MSSGEGGLNTGLIVYMQNRITNFNGGMHPCRDPFSCDNIWRCHHSYFVHRPSGGLERFGI